MYLYGIRSNYCTEVFAFLHLQQKRHTSYTIWKLPLRPGFISLTQWRATPMTSETTRSVCLPLCMKVFSHCRWAQRRQSGGDTDFRHRWEGEMKRQEGGSECTIGMQREKKCFFSPFFFPLSAQAACARSRLKCINTLTSKTNAVPARTPSETGGRDTIWRNESA